MSYQSNELKMIEALMITGFSLENAIREAKEIGVLK